MDMEQLKKVMELCRSITEYLQRNSDPYTEVCISQNGVVIKQCIAGIPNEMAADKDANCLVH